MLTTYSYKTFILLILLVFVHPVYSQQSFYLSADKIIKNDKKKLILAQGNVEIQNGKIKTRSDLLKFDTQKNQITLEGNIMILNEQGDVVFAKKAILDRNAAPFTLIDAASKAVNDQKAQIAATGDCLCLPDAFRWLRDDMWESLMESVTVKQQIQNTGIQIYD